jgi:mannose-6-phosphate isomerase-like protein (cupin superfamily)
MAAEDVTEPTLATMLQEYGIGDRIRALRLGRKMGLVELGQHTSLSPSLLSKIERGRVCPPLGTLLRIAMVFSVGLEHFFADDQSRHVIAVSRAGERKRFPSHVDGPEPVYTFESLDFAATDRASNSYLASFNEESSSESEPHVHDGFETIYVIEGALTLSIGNRSIDLGEGDSIYFDSTLPHAYRRRGEGPCRVLVVTVP